MSRERIGSDTSSNDGEAPPTLRIQPTNIKRGAPASSPKKRPRSEQNESLGSPQRRQFAPKTVERDELGYIPPPSDWEPPQAVGSIAKLADEEHNSSPPPVSPIPSSHESPQKRSPQGVPHLSPHNVSSLDQEKLLPRALPKSPRRQLRFASPQPSSSPSPRPRIRPNRSLPSSPRADRELSLDAHPIPDLRSKYEARRGASSHFESPRLATVPELQPQSRLDGSSSPYGVQRSPEKGVNLSPERPLTMQMHYLMAHGSEADANSETLADEMAMFGNELDSSLAPDLGRQANKTTLESVEIPVLWEAIKSLHARGARLLAEVLEQRQRRVSMDDLPGGYARFSALERQGVETAIVERQKERCMALRSRAANVEQLYLDLRDQLWALEHQKAEADLLQIQIDAQTCDIDELEAIEAQADVEEVEVHGLEQKMDSAEMGWQAEKTDIVTLIAENKAALDQLSTWLLDEQLTEREKRAKQANAEFKQHLENIQRDLNLVISFSSSSQVAYVAAEFLGITVDLVSKTFKFLLRHRGTPVYYHYLRLIETSKAPLRERIIIWHDGLKVQKTLNALARFGVCSFETQDGVLLYKQRLYQPSGELVVRFEGTSQVVQSVINDGRSDDAYDFNEDADVKPRVPTLESVLSRLKESRARLIS